MLRVHTSGILDTVDIILGTVEGGMETPSTFQTIFTNKTLSVFEALIKSKEHLERAMGDSMQHDEQSSAKEFAQCLPPLAFQIARVAKELTNRVEGVMGGEDELALANHNKGRPVPERFITAMEIPQHMDDPEDFS